MDLLIILIILLLVFGGGGWYTRRPGWGGPNVGNLLYILAVIVLIVIVLRLLRTICRATAMRAGCQRVSQARVTVGGEVVGAIGAGWAILLGVGPRDDEAAAAWLADKIALLRVFEDDAGKMNLSATDIGAEFLVVSQFTLYADTSRGRRPGFTGAAPPATAEPLVERFAELLRERGFRVETGRFGALMDVELTNHGPVTIVLANDPWS